MTTHTHARRSKHRQEARKPKTSPRTDAEETAAAVCTPMAMSMDRGILRYACVRAGPAFSLFNEHVHNCDKGLVEQPGEQNPFTFGAPEFHAASIEFVPRAVDNGVHRGVNTNRLVIT